MAQWKTGTPAIFPTREERNPIDAASLSKIMIAMLGDNAMRVSIMRGRWAAYRATSLVSGLRREPEHLSSFLAFDAKAIDAFLCLALFMHGASILLSFKALQHLDVTTASPSFYSVPVFGVLVAFLLPGERLSTAALIGAAIVLVTTVLVVRYDTGY